ncbi:hypothetical protein [Streptomyces cyaneochromogenes]|nr:hypothetical protein [Streptomyces cyaneochromogenes]
MATLAVQVALWTVFGLVLGVFAERVLVPRAAAAVEQAGRAAPVPH